MTTKRTPDPSPDSGTDPGPESRPDSGPDSSPAAPATPQDAPQDAPLDTPPTETDETDESGVSEEGAEDVNAPSYEDAPASVETAEPAAAWAGRSAVIVPRSSRRERVLLRVLWAFLALVVVGVLVAPLVAGVMQDRETEQGALGQAIARGMDVPVGAVNSNECHGDGMVACWRVDRPVSQVADEVQWAIGEVLGDSAADLGATISCEQIPAGGPGVPGAAAGPLSCLVATRFGDSGVFVFVDPTYGVGRHGETRLVGSLVSVTAP